MHIFPPSSHTSSLLVYMRLSAKEHQYTCTSNGSEWSMAHKCARSLSILKCAKASTKAWSPQCLFRRLHIDTAAVQTVNTPTLPSDRVCGKKAIYSPNSSCRTTRHKDTKNRRYSFFATSRNDNIFVMSRKKTTSNSVAFTVHGILDRISDRSSRRSFWSGQKRPPHLGHWKMPDALWASHCSIPGFNPIQLDISDAAMLHNFSKRPAVYTFCLQCTNLLRWPERRQLLSCEPLCPVPVLFCMCAQVCAQPHHLSRIWQSNQWSCDHAGRTFPHRNFADFFRTAVNKCAWSFHHLWRSVLILTNSLQSTETLQLLVNCDLLENFPSVFWWLT